MGSTDQIHDHSDDLRPVDEQLGEALTEVGELIEQKIKDELGEDEYNEYHARLELSQTFDDAEQTISPMALPIAGRALDIAKALVESTDGLPPEVVEEVAERKAVQEFANSLSRDPDNDYLQVYGWINDDVCELMSLEISTQYPGLKCVNVADGLLTFAREMPPGSIAPQLMIIFKVEGAMLDTRVIYMLPDPDTALPAEHVEMDLSEDDDTIEDIELTSFKKATLEALKAAKVSLSHPS